MNRNNWVRAKLKQMPTPETSGFVFMNEVGDRPASIFTLESQHSGIRKIFKLEDCVIHSYRHAFGTRAGEAGVDAFTIMRIMGHSPVAVSQTYVHPTPEAMERAFGARCASSASGPYSTLSSTAQAPAQTPQR